MDPVMAWLLKLGVDPNVAQQLMAPRTAATQAQQASAPSAPSSNDVYLSSRDGVAGGMSTYRATPQPQQPPAAPDLPAGLTQTNLQQLAMQSMQAMSGGGVKDTEHAHQRMAQFFQSRYRMPADQADKLARYTLSGAPLNPIAQKHMNEADRADQADMRRTMPNPFAEPRQPIAAGGGIQGIQNSVGDANHRWWDDIQPTGMLYGKTQRIMPPPVQPGGIPASIGALIGGY